MTILLLEPILIFTKEPLEIMKKHTIEHGAFRMALAGVPIQNARDSTRKPRKSMKILWP